MKKVINLVNNLITFSMFSRLTYIQYVFKFKGFPVINIHFPIIQTGRKNKLLLESTLKEAMNSI